MRLRRLAGVVGFLVSCLAGIVLGPPAQAAPANAQQFLAVVPQEAQTLGIVPIYQVQSGDSLSGIADLFAVDVDSLVSLNNLADPNALQAGDVLVIPDAPTTAVRFGLPPRAAKQNGDAPAFVWPAVGPITTKFGVPGSDWIGGFHMGLDIGAPAGAPIVAAASGNVEAAEFDHVHGYGNYVLIDHGKGYETLYGHMSRIVAKAGDHVEQSDLIGYVGDTGYAFGPHLHFEVRRNGEKIDPEPLLP
jgi:murein DD-endopeptidase MepM/ murein hydrolase activator NlpD